MLISLGVWLRCLTFCLEPFKMSVLLYAGMMLYGVYFMKRYTTKIYNYIRYREGSFWGRICLTWYLISILGAALVFSVGFFFLIGRHFWL